MISYHGQIVVYDIVITRISLLKNWFSSDEEDLFWKTYHIQVVIFDETWALLRLTCSKLAQSEPRAKSHESVMFCAWEKCKPHNIRYH